MIAVDDGDLNSGPVVTKPKYTEVFPGVPAPIYADANLRAATYAVYTRSLRKIVRESLEKKKQWHRQWLSSGIHSQAHSRNRFVVQKGSYFHKTNAIRDSIEGTGELDEKYWYR